MTNFENQEKTFVVGEDLIDDLLEKNKPVKEAVVLVIDDENEFDDLI
jgi:hypothetical protein